MRCRLLLDCSGVTLLSCRLVEWRDGTWSGERRGDKRGMGVKELDRSGGSERCEWECTFC